MIKYYSNKSKSSSVKFLIKGPIQDLFIFFLRTKISFILSYIVKADICQKKQTKKRCKAF